MQRHEWNFEHTAADLLHAARRQKEYRETRATYWEERKAEVMDEVKAKGLTVHEDHAALLQNYTSVGRGGAQIMVDQTLQLDLSEAVEKIKSNKARALEYRGWEQIFESLVDAGRGGQVFDLHHDDWLFFFGKS